MQPSWQCEQILFYLYLYLFFFLVWFVFVFVYCGHMKRACRVITDDWSRESLLLHNIFGKTEVVDLYKYI